MEVPADLARVYISHALSSNCRISAIMIEHMEELIARIVNLYRLVFGSIRAQLGQIGPRCRFRLFDHGVLLPFNSIGTQRTPVLVDAGGTGPCDKTLTGQRVCLGATAILPPLQ